VLDAWLIPDPTARRLTVAGREDGSDRWLTAAEHAHAEADTARAEAEQAREAERLARAAEADALARVRALEAELAGKR
jgi:hypothetical protein